MEQVSVQLDTFHEVAKRGKRKGVAPMKLLTEEKFLQLSFLSKRITVKELLTQLGSLQKRQNRRMLDFINHKRTFDLPNSW